MAAASAAGEVPLLPSVEVRQQHQRRMLGPDASNASADDQRVELMDVNDEEEGHCEDAVCELADREGLVVITPEVVALLMSERAAVRAAERARCLRCCDAAQCWSDRPTIETVRELIESGNEPDK
jgi:hypothetical protein